MIPSIESQDNLQSNSDSYDDERDYFQSKVDFYAEEIEFMITDLKDLLSRLQEKNVIDFDKEKAIMLLDKQGTKIEFKKTEISELKRFLSLIKESYPLFRYLVRNPSSITVTKEVQRSDRIMGSINLQKTFAIHLRYPDQKNTVICNEIHRSSHTPENYILTQILFSINVICNRYLSRGKISESEKAIIGAPTLKNLQHIKNYVADLLSSKIIKDILPNAIANVSEFERYLDKIAKKIGQGTLPKYYTGLINLLYKWKYFVWLSNNNPQLIEHLLRYHFFTIKDENKMNKLYECWVFYKILDSISDLFKIKFKEYTKYKEITFGASGGKIKNIIYQKNYETGWKSEDEKPLLDRPDIVITFENNKVIIVDAKNSNLNTSGYPYRDQMDSYIQSAGIEKTDYGIFLFSRGDENLWKQIKRNNQKMIWMSLTPNLNTSKELNYNAINKLINLIKEI